MGNKYFDWCAGNLIYRTACLTLVVNSCCLGKDSQHHNSHGDTFQMNGIQTEVSKLKEELEEWKKKHELLQGQLKEKDSVIEKLVSTVSAELDPAANSWFQV